MFEISEVGVTYKASNGRPVNALKAINLSIEDGEFVTIIGPSGCGKSTLLHCMGGLLRPSSGQITFDSRLVDKPNPEQYAFVFQDYSLFPWRSVVDNAAIGLQFAGMGTTERRKRAMDQLRVVGLEANARSLPGELSGGMQQRVAVARALTMNPAALLMDEPFGALDEQSRRHLGVEMSNVLSEMRKNVVMVTHSLDEAIFWGDRIVVMGRSPGCIKAIIEVNEARPRSTNFMTSTSFAELRAELFELLEAPGGEQGAELLTEDESAGHSAHV